MFAIDQTKPDQRPENLDGGIFLRVITGLRYYTPRLGRWTSRDPIGEQGGTNLCGYVANRPVSRLDPLGLASSVNVNFATEDVSLVGTSSMFGTIPSFYEDTLGRLAIRDLELMYGGDAIGTARLQELSYSFTPRTEKVTPHWDCACANGIIWEYEGSRQIDWRVRMSISTVHFTMLGGAGLSGDEARLLRAAAARIETAAIRMETEHVDAVLRNTVNMENAFTAVFRDCSAQEAERMGRSLLDSSVVTAADSRNRQARNASDLLDAAGGPHHHVEPRM